MSEREERKTFAEEKPRTVYQVVNQARFAGENMSQEANPSGTNRDNVVEKVSKSEFESLLQRHLGFKEMLDKYAHDGYISRHALGKWFAECNIPLKAKELTAYVHLILSLRTKRRKDHMYSLDMEELENVLAISAAHKNFDLLDFRKQLSRVASTSSNSTASLDDEDNIYPSLDEIQSQPDTSADTMYQPLNPYSRLEFYAGASLGALLAPDMSEDQHQHELGRCITQHVIKQVCLYKDEADKIGLRLLATHEGVYVVNVQNGSPASQAGIRFGEQILSINEVDMVAFSQDDITTYLKQVGRGKITMMIRNRPCEKWAILFKDSDGKLGIEFKRGRITKVSANSLAEEKGLCADDHLTEINEQFVVDMNDSEIKALVADGDEAVSIRTMRSVVFYQLLKCIAIGFIGSWASDI